MSPLKEFLDHLWQIMCEIYKLHGGDCKDLPKFPETIEPPDGYADAIRFFEGLQPTPQQLADPAFRDSLISMSNIGLAYLANQGVSNTLGQPGLELSAKLTWLRHTAMSYQAP